MSFSQADSNNFEPGHEVYLPATSGYPFAHGFRLQERPGFPYTERHIQCLWAEITARNQTLKTEDGQSVSVVHPGRWNLESGPDFTGAVLILDPGRRQISGDIEIHIAPQDWLRHGHQNDPAYNNVIAHVTYLPGNFPDVPPGALRIVLRQTINDDPALLFEDMDVTAFPYHRPPVQTPPCARRLERLQTPEKTAVLEAAGMERLRLKSARIRQLAGNCGEEQAFYETALAALGYRRNAAAFRLTARTLRLGILQAACDNNVETAYAILCGTAGLLPGDLPEGGTADQHARLRQWWNIWWKTRETLASEPLDKTIWRRDGLRPANFPERRMMVAAIWFAAGAKLWNKLRSAAGELQPAAAIRQMRAILQKGLQHDYWSYHYSFSGKRLEKPVKLLGNARIAALINNTVLPMLAATGHDISLLARECPAEASNSITRHTAHALLGRDAPDSLYSTGLRQQGLIQIFNDFCSHPGACRRCAFAQAFENMQTG